MDEEARKLEPTKRSNSCFVGLRLRLAELRTPSKSNFSTFFSSCPTLVYIVNVRASSMTSSAKGTKTRPEAKTSVTAALNKAILV